MAVLLDRRLPKLDEAVEAEGLEKRTTVEDEVLARRASSAVWKAAFVEAIDDVAGNVLLRTREIVEALSDEVRQALPGGAGLVAVRATAADFALGSRPSNRRPKCGWIARR